VYGEAEGLPSDEPNTVFQDRSGRVWVGFHDSGLLLFSGGTRRVYTTHDGRPDDDILQIRQARNGDLLISTRVGLARMDGTHFRNYTPPDPLGRKGLFDAMEDRQGRLWLATPAGLGELPKHLRFGLLGLSAPNSTSQPGDDLQLVEEA